MSRGIIMKDITCKFKKIRRMFRDERGATMIEYAIMVAFIATVAVVAVTAFGLAVNGLFQTVPAF